MIRYLWIKPMSFVGILLILKLTQGKGTVCKFCSEIIVSPCKCKFQSIAFRAWVSSAFYSEGGVREWDLPAHLVLTTECLDCSVFSLTRTSVSESCVLSVVMYLSANSTLIAIMYLLALITFWWLLTSWFHSLWQI